MVNDKNGQEGAPQGIKRGWLNRQERVRNVQRVLTNLNDRSSSIAKRVWSRGRKHAGTRCKSPCAKQRSSTVARRIGEADIEA